MNAKNEMKRNEKADHETSVATCTCAIDAKPLLVNEEEGDREWQRELEGLELFRPKSKSFKLQVYARP